MPKIQKKLNPNDEIRDAVFRRFFKGVDGLVDAGKVSTFTAFFKESGLSFPKYLEMRAEYGFEPSRHESRYSHIDAEAFFHLIRYGVSADWLFRGTGEMLRK